MAHDPKFVGKSPTQHSKSGLNSAMAQPAGQTVKVAGKTHKGGSAPSHDKAALVQQHVVKK